MLQPEKTDIHVSNVPTWPAGTYTHTEVRLYVDGYLVGWGSTSSIPDAARFDIDLKTDAEHDPYGSFSDVRILVRESEE